MTAKILIPLGDPLSINIAAIAHLFEKNLLDPTRVKLIGSRQIFDEQISQLGAALQVEFIDVASEHKLPPTLQLSEKHRGEVAWKSLQKCAEEISRLQAKCAILTCPIDKHAASLAGFSFPGQTEFFTSLENKSSLMLLAGDRLRVGLVTNHCALKDVPGKISAELIAEKIITLHAALKKHFKISAPEIAVCGLNPHAGDQGLFGSEEEIICAGINLAKSQNNELNIHGPVSADTVFYFASQGKFDGVLAMYHDQGLAPFKVMHFDSGINMTCGLSFLRVSPDHGPAKDKYLAQDISFKSFEKCAEVLNRLN